MKMVQGANLSPFIRLNGLIQLQDTVVENTVRSLLCPTTRSSNNGSPLPWRRFSPFFADPRICRESCRRGCRLSSKNRRCSCRPALRPTLRASATRFVASYRALPFLPFRIRSEAEIVGFGLNEFFADVQTKGPFRSWHHRHEFRAENRGGIPGTRLRDRIEYEVGLEPMGRIINALFIAPQMRRTFAYRQRAVERFLGSAT